MFTRARTRTTRTPHIDQLQKYGTCIPNEQFTNTNNSYNQNIAITRSQMIKQNKYNITTVIIKPSPPISIKNTF